MMKILLVACNAKFIHSNPALYDLYSYAGPFREQLVLKEFTINQTEDEVLREIYREEPSVVCFSCYIWNIDFIRKLAGNLKKILPGTAIWAGGPEVSYEAERVLDENPFLTGVMRGEGEKTFRSLCGCYLSGSPGLSEIRGLTYRDKGRILTTPDREVMDLSELVFPYSDPEIFANRIIYYESSRGCPFRCSYCLSSVDKRLRFRDISLVEKELQFFLDRKVPQVKFVDRTFNCSHAHCKAIWSYLLRHDNQVTNFHFEIAADLLDEEELDLLKRMRPGYVQLEIGVQSTNPRTLEEIQRKMDFRRLSEVVTRIRSYGSIHQHLDLIAGLPWEDMESFKASFEEVYRLRPDQLQLGFLKVLPGSPMAERAREYDLVFKSNPPYEVLSTRWLSYKEILELKTVENMVEIYYNSGQFQNGIAFLEKHFGTAYEMFLALGMYYGRKGYEQISHSRMKRYEILMEFFKEEGLWGEEAKECLLVDLYLREKLKKRPSFAPVSPEEEKRLRMLKKEKGLPASVHLECMSRGRILAFDYENRDPLHHNAHVTEISG